MVNRISDSTIFPNTRLQECEEGAVPRKRGPFGGPGRYSYPVARVSVPCGSGGPVMLEPSKPDQTYVLCVQMRRQD